MTLAVGTRVGPYNLLSVLGVGGMDSPLLVKRKPSF
jgi:hypothetical protein